MAAIDPGIGIVERFGANNTDAGLVATLASLLNNRRAPGDVENAYAMSGALLADLPPELRSKLHQLTYEYTCALVQTKPYQKAFDAVDTINPPTARDAAECKELRIEVLQNLRNALGSTTRMMNGTDSVLDTE